MASGFVCDSCCAASKYAVQVAGSSLSLPVWTSILSAWWLLAMAVLLIRMSRVYSRGLSEGYKFVASPVEAIRERGRAAKHYVAPFYFSYVIFNSLFTVLEVLGALPDQKSLSWLLRYLCGAREAVDVVLIVFVCLPQINRWTRWLPIGGGAVILLIFSLFVTFMPAPATCEYCTTHFPISDLSYLFLVEGLVCMGVFVLAWRRPFVFNNPRPAAKLLCGFWAPIYLVLAIILPIMKADGAKSWGFCALMVVISIYYIAYPFIMYRIIVQDSSYIWSHGIDDAVRSSHSDAEAVLDESTERLIRNYPVTELVDLLQEKSLATISSSELDIGPRLGAGAFGEVFRAKYHGTTVAVKSLIRLSQRELVNFVQEISLIGRLRHPHIMLVIGMVLEAENQFLVTEFATLGTLFEAIHHGKLSWNVKERVAFEIALGCEYLHNRDIVHRDLKPGNILLTGDYSVRVADFGLSRELTTASLTGLGTVLYAAPEMLRQDRHGKPADVFSYGVVIWEMCCEELPYGANIGIGRIVMGILNRTLALDLEKYPSSTPAKLRHAVEAATRFDASERSTFKELVAILQ